VRHSLLLLLVPLLCSGCLADLRPDALHDRVAPKSAPQAQALLDAARDAAHRDGATPWTELSGIEVSVHDEFFGLTGSFACPWPENPQTFTYRFRPAVEKGVVRFKDGDQTEWRWGIHDWNTWKQEGGEEPFYEQDQDVLFWLPTLQYFLETAIRLREAEIVDVGGEIELDGKTHQRVYLTWQSYEPNDTVDQYLAYLDAETGRLTRVDFTVRDVAGFLVGTAAYSDFREVGDYVLPYLIEIGDDPPGNLLHRYTIREWKPGVELTESEYAPDPKRAPGKKH
jgi:hypothetical protein